MAESLNKKPARTYPRVPTRFPVEYTAEGRTVHAHASTLGGGGIFLEDPAAPPPGTEITLRLRPARHLPVIEVAARVIYAIAGKGSGIQFTQINPEHQHLILRLIHHKRGDKRKFPRVALATQIYCEELMSLAFSRDVSAGGMLIETRAPLPVGSQINVRFNLDDGGPIVVAEARVKYSVEKLGMGVEFIDLAPADRRRLENFVAASSPQSVPTTKSNPVR